VDEVACTTDEDVVVCATCEAEELPCDRDVELCTTCDVEDEVELAPFVVCTCVLDEVEPIDVALVVVCTIDDAEETPCGDDVEGVPCTDDVELLLCTCAKDVELWLLVVLGSEVVVCCANEAEEELEERLVVKV